MTTTTARRDILEAIRADIRKCSQAEAWAAHSGEDTVWQTWEQLMQEGYYGRARQWWIEEIQPTFTRGA